MNYQAFTNNSLTLVYGAERGALAVDDAPPLSVIRPAILTP